MDELTFKNHCMRCKQERVIGNPERHTMKGGRESVKGKCSECGCPMYKPLSRDEKKKIDSSTS